MDLGAVQREDGAAGQQDIIDFNHTKQDEEKELETKQQHPSWWKTQWNQKNYVNKSVIRLLMFYGSA